MRNQDHIGGIHHITAVASSAAENLVFYRMVLGLYLVKKTVNFDDPYTYHLYYGNAVGAPGTILTFFPWENLPPGKPGAGMVTSIAFSIPRHSVRYWYKRLMARGIEPTLGERFGLPVIHFQDAHGLPLELVEVSDSPLTGFGQNHPVPRAHAVLGLHSATMVQNELPATQSLLVDVMGMTFYAREENRYRFAVPANPRSGRFVDILVDPACHRGRSGAGCVHHIAFRAPSDSAQKNWQRTLRENGLAVTDVRDRKYFRSIYFNEPGGVLFEIATDPPGFSVDEAPEKLGQTLALPAQYEPMRSEIEKRLPSLTYHQTIMPQAVRAAENN